MTVSVWVAVVPVNVSEAGVTVESELTFTERSAVVGFAPVSDP